MFATIQAMESSDFLSLTRDLIGLKKLFDGMQEEFRSEVLAAITERWLTVDPDTALKWIDHTRRLVASLALIGIPADWDALSAVYPVMARRKPEWMKEHVDEIDSKSGRARAITALLSEAAKRDPGQARSWLTDFTSFEDRQAATEGLITGLAESDGRLAMDIALATPHDQGRDGLIGSLVWQSGKLGAAAETALIERIEEPLQRASMVWFAAAALAADSASDPFVFLRESFAANPQQLAASSGAMSWLVDLDATRAAEWANSFTGKARQQLTAQVLATWQQGDPLSAMQWLERQPPDLIPQNDFLWNSALTGLATSVAPEFERWLSTLPEGATRDSAWVMLATQSAQQGNMAQAVEELLHASVGSKANRPAITVGHALVATDPEAAAAVVTRLPEGVMQASVAQGIAESWAEQDPRGVAAWVETIPPGATRDTAAGAMANVLVYADPEAAADWIERISDSNIRESFVPGVFAMWQKENPAKARQWLQKLQGVNEDWRSKTLRRIQ